MSKLQREATVSLQSGVPLSHANIVSRYYCSVYNICADSPRETMRRKNGRLFGMFGQYSQ